MATSAPQTAEVHLIVAQHLIPIDGEILSPGALAFQGERILAVGRPDELRQRFPQAQVEEYSNHCLLPGLVNAHADLSLTHFEKYPHPLPETKEGRILFMAWLVNVSRFKSKLSLDDQQKSIREGLDIVRRSGVTTVGDVCRYPIAVPLYRESGLRIVALAEIENIQRTLAQDEFEQALALVDEILHEENPKLKAGLAPFSAYTLSKNMLRILGSHAIQMGIPLHLHAALTFSEMEFFYDSQGEVTSVLFKEAGWGIDKIPPPHRMTPVQYLHEIGVLKAKPSIVGALHLGPTDSALLDKAGCSRIFAPQSFEKLQAGEVPWDKILGENSPWALGTLSKASGSNLQLWDEMRAVVYRLESAIDRSQAASAILGAATLGGARALGLESEIGSLVKNKQADFILVDSPEEDDSIPAGLVDQTFPERIAAVYIAGSPLWRR